GLVGAATHDTEEIVVKPLWKPLERIGVFSGATILGTGRVALILDGLGLARRARVVREARDRSLGAAASATETKVADDRRRLLLFSAGGRRLALPLESVTRLEEVASVSLERASGRYAVQYRRGILPLAFRAEATTAATTEKRLPVVVVRTERGRSVGLVVDRILDVVDASVPRRDRSAIVQGAVTDLLDLDVVLRATDPTLLEESAAA